jgi:hypothetical protein
MLQRRAGSIGPFYVTFPVQKHLLKTSGSVPGYLSRILDPDFYPSRISDPGSRIQKQQQKRGVKKMCCHTFFCSHKFHITVNYFIFEVLKKIILGHFSKNCRTFYSIATKLSKIWVRDPGSEIRDLGCGKNLIWIPDPEVKKAPDPGSGSATLLLIRY